MLRGPVVVALSLLVVLLPASSRAQLTPPAGSAGAGNSAISGIPAGPANNPTVSNPSGIGNAASSTPSLPSQAAIPVTPSSPGYGNTVVVPRSGLRPARVRTVRRTEIREPRSARSTKTRGTVTAQDKKIDSKYSICRGC